MLSKSLLLAICSGAIVSVHGFQRHIMHVNVANARTSSDETHSASALHAAAFDEAAYEADRLAKDAQAMDDMKTKADAEFANLRTPWKWTIRKRIWDLMEAEDIARQPRPVHQRQKGRHNGHPFPRPSGVIHHLGSDQAAAGVSPRSHRKACIGASTGVLAKWLT